MIFLMQALVCICLRMFGTPHEARCAAIFTRGVAAVYQASFQQNVLQRLAIRGGQLMLSLLELKQDRAGPLAIGVFGTTNG
ncbi:hypothetical protein D3C87_1445220 [compost metagenome]